MGFKVEVQKLFATFDNLQEVIFVLDTSRKVVFANTNANEVFGSGYEGKDFVHVVRHPKCMELIEAIFKGQNSAGAGITIEYPVKAVFNVLVSNMDFGPDEPNYCMISMIDISDLKEAEQMRSDFVANVSHELRSPLTALSGFIETLQGPARNDLTAQTRFLGLMEQEAARMVRLISDLLSLSKVEASLRIKPDGTANVVEILDLIKATLADAAKKENKTLDIEIVDSVEQIAGNQDELTQVFQNLIENAIKYGAADTVIKVEMNVVSGVAGIPDKALSVMIKDQGEGIPKEHLSRLTERFYRVDNHRSRQQGGTGLGLAIVKHIINRHRGRMQIESEQGKGSTFTVFLPLVNN